VLQIEINQENTYLGHKLLSIEKIIYCCEIVNAEVKNTDNIKLQESRPAARKPRDAASVLFG